MINVLNPPSEIRLGYVGENEFRPIQFDVSAWLQAYPQGTVSIVFSRPDGLLYPVVENCTESPAEWKPSAADLALQGSGYVEARIISGDVIGKSSKIQTRTVSSLGSSGNPPDPPVPDWTVEVAQNASNASNSATSAASSATAASASALSASGSATSAASSATTATTKASESSASADAALQSEVNASTSATAAESAQTAAETARTGAQTAETNACTYSTSAGNSATAAAGSATDAQSARDAAVTAKTAAETARDAASSSKTAAATSEANAASSAAAASTSADNASASATAASTSASNASSSANASVSSASASASSASAADAAKTAAASSASAAATSEANAASSAQAAANSAASLVVVNDLVTGGTSNALSAEQGKVLSTSISELNADVDFPVTNLVTNGDFSDGTTGWIPHANATVVDGELKLVATGDGQNTMQTIAILGSTKYYLARKQGTIGRCYIDQYQNDTFFGVSSVLENVGSVIFESKASVNKGFLILGAGLNGAGTYIFDDIILINLTAAFGAGNEPTAAEMDAMLAFYPNSWFDGTVNFAANPKMLPYLLNNIRNLNLEKTSYGVYSGLGVTAQATPDMTVAVATGTIYMATGARFTPTAATVTVTAADSTNPRIDIVYVNSTGVIAYLAGTAAASPSAPSVPADGQKLAEISVAANATTIVTANITVKRSTISGGAWMTPTLLNGSTNITGFEGSYCKMASTTVFLQGRINIVASLPIFTLPVGYRPRKNLSFPLINLSTNTTTARLVVWSTGTVEIYGTVANYALDNVSFRAEG